MIGGPKPPFVSLPRKQNQLEQIVLSTKIKTSITQINLVYINSICLFVMTLKKTLANFTLSL